MVSLILQKLLSRAAMSGFFMAEKYQGLFV
jgi:hypothetical protein